MNTKEKNNLKGSVIKSKEIDKKRILSIMTFIQQLTLEKENKVDIQQVIDTVNSVLSGQLEIYSYKAFIRGLSEEADSLTRYCHYCKSVIEGQPYESKESYCNEDCYELNVRFLNSSFNKAELIALENERIAVQYEVIERFKNELEHSIISVKDFKENKDFALDLITKSRNIIKKLEK